MRSIWFRILMKEFSWRAVWSVCVGWAYGRAVQCFVKQKNWTFVLRNGPSEGIDKVCVMNWKAWANLSVWLCHCCGCRRNIGLGFKRPARQRLICRYAICPCEMLSHWKKITFQFFFSFSFFSSLSFWCSFTWMPWLAHWKQPEKT